MFVVCKTVQRVPRIIFTDRRTFPRNAQLGVKVTQLIECLAADVLCQHHNLVRVFAIE
jgi:hypothetical protein